MKHKVIDNFLDKEIFNKFKTSIFDTHIPWYYKERQVLNNEHEDDIGYYTLNFFSYLQSDFTNFNSYLNLIYEKLKCKSLIESRANSVLKITKKNKLFFHTDYEYENCKTAIFYMNTNNGGTILNKNKLLRIDSVENRMLIFDCKIKHAAEIQTDVKRRIVININYF